MAKNMTYDEFEQKYLGKAIDYDGVAGVQCVDLVDQYLKDVFGITGIWVNGARELYSNFEKYPALVKAFNRIPNTRDLVIKKGDIVVWSGGTWGHTAVGNGEGDIDWFVSLEQNTRGKHEKTQLVKHYFNKRTGDDYCHPVSGVLRAKDQSIVLGKTNEYKVRVTARSGLNVRIKAGMNSACKVKSVLPYNTLVTIDNETTVGGQKWGRIKTDNGWICLTYTKKE